MFDHFIGSFAPEISLDSNGFDSWTDQGVISAPAVCTKVDPIPSWLQHSELKSPWLYVEKSTPGSHLAYTDIGDLQYVHLNGSCPVPLPRFAHPSILVNQPCSKLHVTLEDVTNRVHPKVMWDQTFQLRNTAPGGLGTKVVGYQKAMPSEPANASFIPFCFKNLNDINFFDNKYKLTVSSVAEPADAAVKAFKDVAILRPRPLCDLPQVSFL